ncbi:hypothetical protein [Prochlorococcus marinus]|uniref:hypothetical protein n=1 Tax=Prochlorococcus marinus TaxID=1219 RepID=UPI0022B33814|nr:hypothetical protein [Prochlorococcus marinus]
MAFDSHSLERLRDLGRKLPKSLATPKSSSKEKASKQHPIETELNPQKLFRELIKASSDGTIPPHLINRLKQTELLHSETPQHLKHQTNKSNTSSEISPHIPKEKQPKQLSQKDDLYISFERLLLEED